MQTKQNRGTEGEDANEASRGDTDDKDADEANSDTDGEDAYEASKGDTDDEDGRRMAVGLGDRSGRLGGWFRSGEANWD